MNRYEFRWPDGARRAVALPSDQDAFLSAANTTVRGERVEIWWGGRLLAKLIGTVPQPDAPTAHPALEATHAQGF